jgi:Uma2 family endonuclease
LPTTDAEPSFMGMPETLTPVYWTADMVRRLPEDGNRYEVVYGELLVTPAPRLWHQQLVGRLYVALATYLETSPVGVVLASPADISWGQDVLVQPDVFVAPVEQARTLDWAAIRDLLLVVEVLSPSSPRQDRFIKRRRYQEAGVPLYWIVDGDEREVEVWTPKDLFPRIERDRLTWQPVGAAGSFSLSLQELFRPI